MAATKDKDVVARGADVPLALAQAGGAVTRDALLDPRDTDYIPDVDTKGYHVGEVRQPAEPVLKRNGDVEFESLAGSGASKFPGSYAEEQAAMDERLSSDPAYAGTLHTPITTDPKEADRLHAERVAAAKKGRTGSGETDKLEAKANAVADAQAAEDRK